jgi:beta-lactamase regulating signal transducer with metallopeptidase domain
MTEFLNHLASSWWAWMAPMFLQSTILVAIVWVADWFLRRRVWPQVRYAIWVLILVKLLIPPTWSMPTAAIPFLSPKLTELQTSQARSDHAGNLASVQGAQETAASLLTKSSVAGLADVMANGRTHPTTMSWKSWVMCLWLIGIGALALTLILKITRLRRWHIQHRRRSEIPEWFHELMVQSAQRLRLGRVPSIVFSAEAAAPAVYGLLNPTMLLPDDYFEALSREEAEHVVTHELAHLKRGDLWAHTLCQLVRLLYWFNPLVLLVSNKVQHLRELCCDQTVAAVLREGVDGYRNTLRDTARRLLTRAPEPGMGFVGLFEEPGRVVDRLLWIDRPTWHSIRTVRLTAACVIVAMGVFLLPMGDAPEAEAAPLPIRGIQDLNKESLTTGPISRVDAQDYCIIDVVHFKTSRFLFFKNVETRRGSELWIGDERIALHEERRSVILDNRAKKMTYINHRDRTYVEIPLPFVRDQYISEDLKWHYRTAKIDGIVKSAKGHRTVLGHRCSRFEVTSWDDIGGDRANERTVTAWTTTDIPFDLALYHQLLDILRRLDNRSSENRRQLDAMRGIQLRLECSEGGFVSNQQIVSEVIELEQKTPPTRVYEIPEGYSQREQLGEKDIKP